MAFIGNANNYKFEGEDYKHEMKKTVEKMFSVNKKSILEMDGTFSDFIITTWDKQQINFKVDITVKSDNEENLKAKFNSIDIKLAQKGNTVTAETVFGEYKYESFNGSLSIKYYVQVPKDVAMDLETKYGDITIDEARRKLEAKVKYGDFEADKLLIDDITNNTIEVKYGNINIDNVNQVRISLGYGNAKINKCQYINGTLKYSKIFITDLKQAEVDLHYSTMRIENAEKVIASTRYSDTKVLNCTDMLHAKLSYSDLTAAMTSDAPAIDIDSQYSDAIFYINENASFTYDLDTSYSDIIFKGFFDKKSICGHGQYGKGRMGKINISTKYGDIKFYKNK